MGARANGEECMAAPSGRPPWAAEQPSVVRAEAHDITMHDQRLRCSAGLSAASSVAIWCELDLEGLRFT